jgi:hypothetical protein
VSDDLSPEEDVVRRLLAQARHDEPTPDDVVARLDAQLADLRAERLVDTASSPGTTATDPSPVTDLAAARGRRRRVPALLAAAAAVVVGGVALTTMTGNGTDSADDAAASDAGGAAEGAPPYSSEDRADSDAGSGQLSRERSDSEPASPQSVTAVPVLTDDGSLRDDVRRLVDVRATADTLDETGPAWPECATTPLPDGEVRWVLVDDRPGAVVVLEATERRQPVEVWLCGDSDALRTYTFRSR